MDKNTHDERAADKAARELAEAIRMTRQDRSRRAQRNLHDAASRGRQTAAGNKRFTPRTNKQRGR